MTKGSLGVLRWAFTDLTNSNSRTKRLFLKSWAALVSFFTISYPTKPFSVPKLQRKSSDTYKVVAVAVAEWLLSWLFAQGSKKLPFSLLGLFHGCDLLTKPNPAINPDFYIKTSYDYVARLGLGNKTKAIKFLFVSGSDRIPLSTLNRVDLTWRMSQQANTFFVL